MSKGETTRQRIIQEAAAVFNTKGYEGSSVSDLLEATGLKKGGLYRHFESKEEIALQAFDYAWTEARAVHRRCMDPNASPKEQLFQFIDSFAHPEKLPVPGGCPLLNTAIDSDDGNPKLRNKAQRALSDWLSFLESLVFQGIRQGELSEALNPQEAASCITATLEGALMMSRLTDSLFPLNAAAAFLVEWLSGNESVRS
jgi:AcrR family transcriptional regulator